MGKPRQSAYRLRKQAGAESFSAAWDGAQAFARRLAAASSSPVANMGIETLLVPRTYRSRLIGFVRRENVAGALRTLQRLDRMAEGLGDAQCGDAGGVRAPSAPRL